MTFVSFPLDAALVRATETLGFSEPTPIQAAVMGPAIEGRDILACAMTGSGKTAAFSLPILEYLLREPGKGTRALVLTPTRELAAQVQAHIEALAQYTRIKVASVFGGVRPGPQERAIRAGVEIIVATPGRLLDHMQQPWCRFDDLDVLVLDEADRMLDMGFLPDVRRIMDRLPRAKQTLLFSATMPQAIVALSRDLLEDPLRIGTERKAAPATGIAHTVMPVSEKLKPGLLLALLAERPQVATLVFTRTKHRANRLADHLEKRGIRCDRIHGNRSQAQREDALRAFKSGRLQVLVATDIAARGIDIEALPLVVNFDVPPVPEDYVHRAGRTARAGDVGDSVIFSTPEDARDLKHIERFIGKTLPRRRLEGFDYDAAPQERFEVPLAERIAEIRARKAEDRARAAANAERRAKAQSMRANSAPSAKANEGNAPRRSSGHRPAQRRNRSA